MNRQQRAPRSQLHSHCESCYSRHCRKKVDISVSCVLAQCRLHCGALYHLCKEEEHTWLCPNARVPCLNAESGCPLTMPRSCQASHLRECPASVVCCSMEWNRWPAEDAHAHPTTELRQNLLRDNGCRAECLDLAMSLRDQDHLFHSVKMKELFPELTQRLEEDLEGERKAEEMRKKKEEKKRAALEKERVERDARRARWKEEERVRAVERAAAEARAAKARAAAAVAAGETEEEEERELTLEEREALATAALSAEQLQKFSSWDKMFTSAIGGCREAGIAAAGGSGQGEVKGEGLGALAEEDENVTSTCMDKHACTSSSSSMTGGGSKGFEWSVMEPMKILSVRFKPFKAPTSFHARNIRGRNPWAKRENVGSDTSDLGVPLENMPLWDEVQASLLCCLEKEQRGHLIAEASSGDTLLSDQGSQTYNFLSAPFRHDMALADLTARRPPELHLQLQVESVTSIHNKATCAFNFLCGHSFQRREYGQHYRNVHSDIQMSVNGWFEQRCPLSYLGCTYTQRRFQPSTQKATVNYIQELSSYSLCPVLPASPEEGSVDPQSSTEPPPSTRRKRAGRAGGGGGGGTGQESLSSLPYEVLCHMASFLDSLSLSQLALVSHLMREVCSSLLQDRGMVTLHWERKTYSHGGAKWRVKHKVWQFSTLFSPVDRWGFQDVPSMSEHLKVCPYYERECRTERVLLPRIKQDKHINTQCKGPSLIGLFQKDKLIM